MSDFDTAFANVIDAEAGLSMDADDPGNWTGGAKGKGVLKGTKYGISAMSYPKEDIAGLTLGRAMDLYRRDYWIPAGGEVLPWPLNYALFDTVVNQGGGPAYWLGEMQDALHVTNDAAAKGLSAIGPRTKAAALAAVASPAGRLEVIGLFIASRMQRYAARSDPKFQRGLFKRGIQTAMRCVS